MGDFQGLQESPLEEVHSRKKGYNEKAQSGATVTSGEEINREFTRQGETVVRGSGTSQVIESGNSKKNKRQVQRRNVGSTQTLVQETSLPIENTDKSKKKFTVVIILGVVLVVAVIVFLIVRNRSTQQVAQEQDYTTSGRYAYDRLQNALLNYSNPSGIDEVVGTENGDSWLAQEWAYVNGVKLRQEFLQKVGGIVKFTYPQVQQLSTSGTPMKDSSGNDIYVDSYMNSGESVIVTVPDYELIIQSMDEEQEYIRRMFVSYQESAENDYRIHDDMFNLMMQYLCDKQSLPTKEVELALPVRLNIDNVPYIEDDSLLDDELFGNEAFRLMSEKFSQLALGWTGFIEEKYTEKEEQHNEEFDAWYEKFIVLYEADGGTYDPETHTFSGGKFTKNSKWEPWYLRDENNVIQLDENGEQIVNYFSIKDENGNDWIQPDEVILVDVEKTRQIEDPWVNESGIAYNCLGVHYIETEYAGWGSTVFRVGDGSVEHPAGIGTPIITKALCSDGKYHDVEVALIGYWIDADAIEYAEKFSSRNRGFTTVSVVKLITFELTIKNLEDAEITLDSEMTLCDRNANVSSRTGTMYDFTNEGIVIAPHETVTVNDWASSTELEQKYVCWGKSFGRQFSTVYFDCLAGTGVIPSYSAYEQFVGTSKLSSN